METIEVKKDKVIIEFKKEEFNMILNALNVVCEEIEEWELGTRLGIELKDAKIVLETLISMNKQFEDKIFPLESM